jgi:hypothetical protein
VTAITTNYGAGFADGAPRPQHFATKPEASNAGALGLGLQLTRASTIALTRLQIAVCKGERRQALEAIDRLHVLDRQLEQLVAGLDDVSAEDRDWRELSAYVADQKLALAFDKLVLASGISGPDMASPAGQSPGPGDGAAELAPASTSNDEPPMIDWHAFPDVQPTRWNPFANRLLAFVLALMVTAMLAVAVVTMTGF